MNTIYPNQRFLEATIHRFSVLYSAAYSPRGYSRDLIMMAARGENLLVISDLVIEEVQRNLANNAPEIIPFLDFLFELLPLEKVNPNRKMVLEAIQITTLKDTPILAAARKAKVDLLVTLDKKHLLGKTELAQYAEMRIVTPQEAVAFAREE